MSGEINLDYGTSGANIYALLLNSSGLAWNGSAFEAIVNAHWTTYAVALTEQGTTGVYLANFPAVSAGYYAASFRLRAGGSPAVSDSVVGTPVAINWGGVSVVTTSTGDYCTLAGLRYAVGITNADDTKDDATLSDIITAVSRTIESTNYCNRKFYPTNDVRYYTPISWNEVPVDDLLSVTEIAIDTMGNRSYTTILTTSDYDLWPWNAPANGQPYVEIRRAPMGGQLFSWYDSNAGPLRWPYGDRGVRVTGTFGYSLTTPPQVNRACLLQCARIYKRGDAPFGVLAAPGAMGQLKEIPLDPDVEAMLVSLKRLPYGPF